MIVTGKISLLFVLNLLTLVGLAACTKAVPDIQSLGSLSGFSVDQTLVAGQDFRLSGVCSSQFTAVEVSIDNGTSWRPASTYSPNFSMNCADGNFSGDFSFTLNVPSFLVRGVGQLGVSGTTVVAVTPLVPRNGASISAGIQTATNGTFKIKGSLRTDTPYKVLSNANVKLKGSLVSQ